MNLESHPSLALFVSLGIGLLVGLERGWEQRSAEEGERVAGIRTFALVGLFGGVAGLLGDSLGAAAVAAGFVAITALVVAAYALTSWRQSSYGITTAVAALGTFGLGAVAAAGYPQGAAAAAVFMALLLGLKPEMHEWLRRLRRDELVSALQLLLISVVVLPLLPDRGLGPWEAFNPYRLWWLVVLVAGLSFCGHFAIRLLGEQRGVLLTGAVGGLASSTALTVQFARRGRLQAGLQPLLAVGIVLASATVPARMLVEVAVVNRQLLPAALPPLLSMVGATAAVGLALWWGARRAESGESLEASRPFRLSVVLYFALLLAVISVAGEAARVYLGSGGVYALAGIAGLADADAVTVSLANASRGALEDAVAVRALVLVAMAAAASKALLSLAFGGRALALRVVAASVVTAAAGVPWLF